MRHLPPLLVCLLLLISAETASADPPKSAVHLDGITALVGGHTGSELEATPILMSDVLLQATLMQLYRHRNVDFEAEKLTSARRVVVMVNILSNRARQFQEKIDDAEVAAMKRLFTERAGGFEAMREMLDEIGVTETELDKWCEKIVLAASQVRYVESQIELPTGEEIAANLDSEHADDLEHYDEVRRRIVAERLDQTVKVWLVSVLTSANVRIVR